MVTKKAETIKRSTAKSKDLAPIIPDTKPDSPAETIFMSSGQEKFAPIPYFSFDVGPVSITTTVRETEAYQDCIDRCSQLLNDTMQKQFTEKMHGFFDRMGQLDEYMIERGLASRKQQDVVTPKSSKPQADMSVPPAVMQGPRPVPTVDNMLGFVGDPIAAGTNELPSTGQSALFGQLQKRKGVDGRELCVKIFGCEPHNLKRAAMSKLLDHINDSYPDAPKPTAISNAGDDDVPF